MGKISEHDINHTLYVTETNDNETCLYCGYYVKWRSKTKKNKKKNILQYDEHVIHLDYEL
jgi:hypothetical protein